MMNKLMYMIGGWLLCSATMSAQPSYQKATEKQVKEIIDHIKQTSGEMKTMTCDFTQVKELSFMDEKVTSDGKMYYRQANKIRWEYLKPYTYVFATDGQNVITHSGSSTSKMPVKSSKLFSEISKVMIGGVSGNGLIDSPDFSTEFGVGKEDYMITLTPLKKEVKDFFSSIRLYVNQTDYRIHTVDLVEKSGDKTSIHLKNIRINTPVNDEVFSR
ncbi:MAG: outer membrane lipoprotein carrier protein LolA [Tannerella sp.]|jgi:outer membrane lipoprotein-sorting protein|nr:outer membrane lipoprotein carrier protein LolA [Tannerella sp.]